MCKCLCARMLNDLSDYVLCAVLWGCSVQCVYFRFGRVDRLAVEECLVPMEKGEFGSKCENGDNDKWFKLWDSMQLGIWF